MKIKAPDALLAAEVSRRGLMKTTAIGGLALASNALYRQRFSRYSPGVSIVVGDQTMAWVF